MKVAPTQQVTVSAPGQSAGVLGLASKIDELLRLSKKKKAKTQANKAFMGAKKQYKQYRKKALSTVAAENKDIAKKERARINNLPKTERAAARKKLKDALKQRVDKVKSKLPAKIQTPGQLKNLITSFRTLKV